MQTNKNAVHGSFVNALHVTKTIKPHTIGETLRKPCIQESVKLMLGAKKSLQKMRFILVTLRRLGLKSTAAIHD